MGTDRARLDREGCRNYIEEHIFPLRRGTPLLGAVGLELEMLPMTGVHGTPRQVPHADVLRWVQSLARTKTATTVQETPRGSSSELVTALLLADGASFSFEPGGQVEYSTRPFPRLADVLEDITAVQGELDQAAANSGAHLLQIGMNPWHTLDQISLQLPKRRYVAMTDFFRRFAPAGLRMMRQTCALQVALDLGPDEETMAKRYLAAQLLAPFCAGIFANSAFSEGKAAECLGFRSKVWRGTDGTRTGIPSLDLLRKGFNRKNCIDTYLEFVLNANVVCVEKLDYFVPESPLAFKDWMQQGVKGVYPSTTDLLGHLSMLFPEVRPRGFLELRSADAPGRTWQSVPALFASALLYDGRSLDAVLETLLPHSVHIQSFLTRSRDGLLDPQLFVLARKLMDLAAHGIERLAPDWVGHAGPAILASYREYFTERQRTPGMDMLDLIAKTGATTPTLGQLLELEHHWLSQIHEMENGHE